MEVNHYFDDGYSCLKREGKLIMISPMGNYFLCYNIDGLGLGREQLLRDLFPLS